MNKRCIINVSIGKQYTDFQQRLIQQFNTEFHSSDIDLITFSDTLPIGSRSHEESMYGFKMHAFQSAFNSGYESVIWLDAGVVLKSKHTMDVFFTLLESSQNGAFTMVEGIGEKDKFHKNIMEVYLSNFVNDKTLNYFNLTREFIDQEKWLLNYGFLFGFTKDSLIYLQMLQAEKDGCFGSVIENEIDTKQNSGILNNGKYSYHRHEEAVLSILLQKDGSNLIPYNYFSHLITVDNERIS